MPECAAKGNHLSITLSICIPTYNRARFLAQAIESVLSQATEHTELVVSDNGSTDETHDLVRQYQKQFPRITYFRHAETVGRDQNYLQAVEAAHGEYCWLLGDDDVLEENAVERLLTHLCRGSAPEFLLLTGIVYDSSLRQVLGNSADQIGVTEDISTRDVLQFFARFFCESGLSVFVVRHDKWHQVNPEKYLGTGLVYLGIVYEYLALDSLVEVVARPSIKYRSGNASWSRDTLEIIVGHMNAVMTMLPDRYDPVKDEAMARLRKRVPITLKMLASLRASGFYDRTLYRKYLSGHFQDAPALRCTAALLAVLPVSLFRGLKAVLGK